MNEEIPTPSTALEIKAPKNLSVLCVSVVDEILQRTQEEGLQHNEDLIHQVRVLTKRLRAAWNLVRGIVPVEKVKQRRAALRDLSAQFSGSRDQAVLKDLCGSLANGQASDQERALQAVGEGIQLSESGSLLSPDELAKQLEIERQGWLSLDWSNEEECREIINQRWEKSFRNARKTTKRARKSVCSEAWHEWRKALKQLRYQSEFLADLEGRPLTDFELGVRDLGSLLGQRNDLDNLEKYLDSEHARKSANRASIDSIVDESTRKIMKKCRKLGKALFRHKLQNCFDAEPPPTS